MNATLLDIATPLLAWYDRHRRVLPWRALPGETPDPYKVWLSEIMLQQTVVATVVPYFRKFVSMWPAVGDLANASLDDVLAAWAGLGYYARARNLHACAGVVARVHGGRFPADHAALLSLPGVGAYTAGAIAAIAFDQPLAAPDGNVERVVTRLYGIEIPLASARPRLRGLAQDMVPRDRPGDFAQAMMDLGATICVPGRPRCLACPLTTLCEAFASGAPERLPVRPIKAARPKRYGRVYWITDAAGRVLVRRRPPRGLLGGLLEFPSSDWLASPPDRSTVPPFAADWKILPRTVRHVFTHFELELDVAAASSPGLELSGEWVDIGSVERIGLPSLMVKVARAVADCAA